jgi:hypothetical protein
VSRSKVWVRPVLLFLAGFLAPQCVLAQSPRAPGRANVLEHSWEVSVAYVHVLTDGTFGNNVGLNGFTASVSRSLLPAVQVTGEVGDYSGGVTSVKSFLGGAQFKIPVRRFEPFIRVLGGLSRAQSNAFTIAGGGGIDLRWNERVAIRLVQIDEYLLFPGGHAGDYARIGFGVTYAFGK